MFFRKLDNNVKRFEFLIEKSMEVIATKDSQIETLEKSLATVISTATNMMSEHDKHIKELNDNVRTLTEAIINAKIA